MPRGGLLALTLAVAWTSQASASENPPFANASVEGDVAVTATDLRIKYANNSPLLVDDPTDGRFVAMANRLDGPQFGCALQVSGDRGRTWTTAHPVRRMPAGADRCYGSEAAFDRHGRLYYLFVGLRGLGNKPMGVFLTSSTDRARTFGPPRRVLGGDRFGVRMAIDQTMGSSGRLHLAWLEARSPPATGGFQPGKNPIMTAHSDDAGETFSKPIQVNDPSRPLALAPVLALGPNHRVHVGYYDLGDDQRDYQGLEGPVWPGFWSIVVATSEDGGQRFNPGVVAEASVAPPQRVMLVFTMPPASLVAGPSRSLYIAWHDARNGDWDVFFRSSADGRTWGPARRVNDDPLGNRIHQYLPRLSVAPNGRLDVVFYDRRKDVDNIGVWAYHTFSTDGGATFAPNVVLNKVGFSSFVGPGYRNISARGLVEFGGRLGLISHNDYAIAAWADTRNTTRGPPAQDIFAARIRFGNVPRVTPSLLPK